MKLDSDGTLNEKGVPWECESQWIVGGLLISGRIYYFGEQGVTSPRERLVGFIKGCWCPSQRGTNVERGKLKVSAGKVNSGLSILVCEKRGKNDITREISLCFIYIYTHTHTHIHTYIHHTHIYAMYIPHIYMWHFCNK